MTKKTKKLLFIGCILLFILILGAIYTVVIKPLREKERYEYEETEVYAGTLSVEVSESGSLSYEIKKIDYDIDVNSINSDEDEGDDEDEELTQRYLQIEEMYAVSGVQFTKNQPLLKFTDDSVESVRKLLQSALADAKAEYNDASKEYNLSALEAQTVLEKQQIAQKYASKIRNGKVKNISNNISSMLYQVQNKQEKVEDLQESMDTAYKNYREAADTYAASKEYYDGLAVNNSDLLTSYMSTYLNNKNAYERALETYRNAVDAYQKNADEIEALNSDIVMAKAKQTIEKLDLEENYQETVLYGEYAEIIYQASIEDLKETLKKAEEKKKNCEEKLETFEELAGSEGILYAKEDGIITDSSYEAGDELETTGTLLSYATNENMTISIDVTEEDVVYLSVGDEVQIEFNAYPEEKYKGIITSINTTATSAETPTVSYQVKVQVNGSLNKLFGGMTAKVTFVTKVSQDTVYIQRKALVEENGSYYVYRKTGIATRELVPVTVGIKNESYVEILSGITSDDVIYIPVLISRKSEE